MIISPSKVEESHRVSSIVPRTAMGTFSAKSMHASTENAHANENKAWKLAKRKRIIKRTFG